MPFNHKHALLPFVIGLCAAQEPPATQPDPTSVAPTVDKAFEPVQAILDEHCVSCHSGARPPRGANFETVAGVLAERAGRPRLIVPGDPEASEIYRRVTGAAEPRMPLDGPPWLTDAQIEVIRVWITGLTRSLQTPAQAEPATPSTAPTKPAPAPATPAPARKQPATNATVTFADVRPILAANCMRCHVNNGERGPAPEGLVLTNLDSVMRSSERPVVIPGNAAASLMIRHIIGSEKPRMPFDGPPWLEAADVDLITRWIDSGARDDHGKPSAVPVGREVRFEGTLTAQWAVDGIPFRVQGGARVRDVRVGGRVEVRATIQADGSLLATRVRGR